MEIDKNAYTAFKEDFIKGIKIILLHSLQILHIKIFLNPRFVTFLKRMFFNNIAPLV